MWIIAAHIEALPAGDPRKTHVCFMALYARDVLTAALAGPYTDDDAERFARLALTGGLTVNDETSCSNTAVASTCTLISTRSTYTGQ